MAQIDSGQTLAIFVGNMPTFVAVIQKIDYTRDLLRAGFRSVSR